MDKLLLIGSYTVSGERHGIHTVRMDMQTGDLSIISAYTECENPSFLARMRNTVFAVHELKDRGCIASYRVDDRGVLKREHREDMPGGLMCHLKLWPGGRYLTAANYLTGSLLVCPISVEGIAGAPVSVIQYHGKGADPRRQKSPHPHSSAIDPSGKWLVCADLGTDRIFVYGIDVKKGRLWENAAAAFVKTPDGSGPRHFSFNPNGTKLYVSAELSNQVLVYDFASQTGRLIQSQSLSTLPADFVGNNLAADIHCDSNGNYLYVSNRGHDSIAAFRIRPDGNLACMGWRSCHGSDPRSFLLLSGWMLIANQSSGNVVACRIDENGMPGRKAAEVLIPQAAHVLPL